MKTVALVAAKGESRRVPNKNTRPFANTNLTELKLRQLKRVPRIDEVVLSSESEVVLDIGRSVGGITLHKRDPLYSTDDISMSAVYSYLANEISGDIVVWVPVTNPLVDETEYNYSISMYNHFREHNFQRYDCLLTVTKVSDYLIAGYGQPLNFTRHPWMKSQDLSGIAKLNFASCVLKREDMARWGTLVGARPFLLFCDSAKYIDIDSMEQFEFCEFLYKRKLGLV